MDFIQVTPPSTIAGCAVKLRILMHEDVGLPAGDGNYDITSLEQIRDFLTAAAGPHHGAHSPIRDRNLQSRPRRRGFLCGYARRDSVPVHGRLMT
jgi:hypothetical protein